MSWLIVTALMISVGVLLGLVAVPLLSRCLTDVTVGILIGAISLLFVILTVTGLVPAMNLIF